MASFPYLARTTLKYKSPHATDLSFAKDETIRVTGPSDDDEDWLVGETMDGSKSGGFPKDFIVPIEDEETKEEPATAPAVSAPAPVTAPTPDQPPMSKEAPAPPSPTVEPAKLPPSAAPSPAPVVPPPAQAEDGSEPAKQSMKERLAFFAAAQNKVAPPPPIKPKPAAGGLTWSQRQKLRQEQEAKEAETGGAAAAPTSAAAAPPVAATHAPAPASVAPVADDDAKSGSGLSAADAQSSIGKGGSLKERMAALRGAGAFGAPEAKVAPTPPAKPSGKVWSRPDAPEPQPEEEETAGETKDGEEATEDGEKEETEEEQEKARRAAIASRMAKLGARGPMGMAAPPKPARKPTMEATSPTVEKSESVAVADSAESPVVEKEPELSISPPTSVAMPSIPRRTAGPRRAARPAAAKPDEGVSKETVHPDGTISPPPAVMVANEEEPLPKSEDQLAQEKQHSEAGAGPQGLQGAQAAGIALAPADGSVKDAEEEDEEAPVPAQTRQVPQMVPVHPPASSGPPTDDGEDEDEEAVPKQPRSPSHAMLGLPKDEIEMKHEHDAAAEQEDREDDDQEEEDDAPPPPPRILADRPTGPRPLPPMPAGPASPTRAAGSDEEEDEEDESPPPPPPPARQPSMPLPARPVPPPADSDDEEVGDAPPPPPPVRRPTLPPPAIPASAAMEDDEDVGEEEDQVDEVEEEPMPPPPPRRLPSTPGIQIPTSTPGPKSPMTVSPVVSTSPTRSKIIEEPAALSAEPEAGATEEDEEAIRRQGIAARMAKLGGIKFGVPPPVPKIKRTMTSDEPSSPAINRAAPETPTTEPTSPIVATRPAPPVDADDGDQETAAEESERRRKTLARLRAGGTLGHGMFGGHAQQEEEPAVKEEEAEVPEQEEREVAEPPISPVTARPPVPSNRPLPTAPAPLVEAEEEDEEDAPPPPSRSSVPATRPMPPAPEDEEDNGEEAPPPPPPMRPTRTMTSDIPPSPMPSNSVRTGAPILAPQAMSGPTTDEPAEMAPRSPDTPTRPPPIQTSSHMGTPQQQPVDSPTARRSMSIASRPSFQSTRSPSSPSLARQESGRVPAEGRSSLAGGRPGFNELQAASQDAGARILRVAQGLFAQGKRGYIGDGTPAGFLMVVYEQAQLARPEQSWGQVVYEQEAESVLKKSDTARPGDVVALYDARLKGRKGLSSYNQHVGSVEEPLVGVVTSMDQKKKLKVLQVERAVLDEVSYRLDDLKSGRVVVYRPGV